MSTFVTLRVELLDCHNFRSAMGRLGVLSGKLENDERLVVHDAGEFSVAPFKTVERCADTARPVGHNVEAIIVDESETSALPPEEAVAEAAAPTQEGATTAVTATAPPAEEPSDDEILRMKLVEACKARGLIRRDSKSMTVEVLRAKLEEYKAMREKMSAEADVAVAAHQKDAAARHAELTKNDPVPPAVDAKPAAPPAVDGKKVDHDDVRKLVQQVSTKRGIMSAKKVIEKHGAANVLLIPADKLAEVAADLRALL